MGQERLSAKDICDLIRTLKLHTLKILNIINTLIKSYQDLLEENYYDEYLVHKEHKIYYSYLHYSQHQVFCTSKLKSCYNFCLLFVLHIWGAAGDGNLGSYLLRFLTLPHVRWTTLSLLNCKGERRLCWFM